MAFCDDPAHHWVRDVVGRHGARPALPDDRAPGGRRDERSRLGDRRRRLRLDGPGPQPLVPAHPDAVPRPRRRPRARRVRRRRRGPAAGAPSSGFGFREATDDWRKVVEHPDVDVVVVTAPNMLHVEIASAAAAPRARRCSARSRSAARRRRPWPPSGRLATSSPASATTTAGRRSCSTPRQLVDAGRLGRITNYRGRFLSCYGNDPLGLLSWRFLVDQAGHGVSTDLLSHAVDLALHLVGPITDVVGFGETFIRERPLPTRRRHATTTAARRATPTGAVTNEDWFGAIVRFADGAVGTFEASRSMAGPESQHGFEIYGTRGLGALEPGADERARGLPRPRRAAHRVHDGVRRRPLRRARRVRARAGPTRSASRTSSRSRTTTSPPPSPRGGRSTRASRRPSRTSACRTRMLRSWESRAVGDGPRPPSGGHREDDPDDDGRGDRALPDRPAHRRSTASRCRWCPACSPSSATAT